jgi:hypothetical protein
VALNGLSSRALKRRLGQAAAQLGVHLKWARAASPTGLYFQVTPQRTATRVVPRRELGRRRWVVLRSRTA